MTEVSIRLRPLPGSPWIKQDPAFMSSEVSIAQEASKHLAPLVIVGVYLNGVPRPFRLLDPVTLRVSPLLPLEGDRLEIRCLTASEPQEPPKAAQATHPLPGDEYGFQRPVSPHTKASQ